MDIYNTLGVKRVINADAPLTRLGGSLMPEPVRKAMDAAARSYVDMYALQRQAGRRLAELTRNEAAYVCNGASAGLFLSTLACTIGSDRKALVGWPDAPGIKNEVVIHCAHRIPYDPAVRLAGARLVEIGNAIQTFDWELEAVINERTAAVLYIAGAHVSYGALPLEEVVAIAHARGVPVIVDAAAQLPPPENLWRFTREQGADLVIFSGGKDIHGPQASGMILGRADLIEACASQGSPNQFLGRPMKVGKEETAGLVTAVELYLAQDHSARMASYEAIVQGWIDAVAGLPGVHARRDFPNEAGRPLPRVLISFDQAACGLSGADVCAQLWAGDPAIAVAPAGFTGIYMTPDTLQAGEEEIVIARLRQLLRGK